MSGVFRLLQTGLALFAAVCSEGLGVVAKRVDERYQLW